MFRGELAGSQQYSDTFVVESFKLSVSSKFRQHLFLTSITMRVEDKVNK
jgi:hypothetical protein